MTRKTKAEPETISVEIKSWLTGAVLFAAVIPADTPPHLHMKVAVEKAVEAGANLAGANLTDASLTRASLARAILAGANLTDASMRLPSGDDWKIARLVARANRSDGHEAVAFLGQDGTLMIKGGCAFLSLTDFRAKADAYINPDRKVETHNILDFVEAEAARQSAEVGKQQKGAAK